MNYYQILLSLHSYPGLERSVAQIRFYLSTCMGVYVAMKLFIEVRVALKYTIPDRKNTYHSLFLAASVKSDFHLLFPWSIIF